MFAISSVGREHKVEVGTLCQTHEIALKVLESGSETAEKHKWFVFSCLFYQFLLVVGDIIELVGHADILVILLFHYYLSIIVCCSCKGTKKTGVTGLSP